MQPTLLIVSYHFAPSSAVGAKRFSFLARELTRQGFDIRVYASTTGNKDLHSDGEPDPSLPVSGAVHRSGSLLQLPIAKPGLVPRIINAFFRRILAPLDQEAFWIPAVIRMARQEERHRTYGDQGGVVIATLPPNSAAIAAVSLSRRHGWPLILDYRDPWSAYPWTVRMRAPVWRKLGNRIERYCVKRAAAIVVNTPEMREWFIRYFPEYPQGQLFVIPNGMEEPPPPKSPAARTLDIVHAGAVYDDRSIVPVLRSLASLAQRRPDLSTARLVTYGSLPDSEWRQIRAERLQGHLVVNQRVSKQALTGILQEAQALLVVSGDEMSGYSIPYKTYDYIATGRPILAISKAGTALDRFMEQYQVGLHVDPLENEKMESAIEQLLDGQVTYDNRKAVADHLWQHLASQFQEVIRSVAVSAKNGRQTARNSLALHEVVDK